MSPIKQAGRLEAHEQATIPATRSYEVMSIISGEEDFLLDGRSSPNDERPADSHARLATMLAINAASILEKTDEQLLPSVYKYVGCSFNNATPAQLAVITSSRAACQALASALGGYLGHSFNRSSVIAGGCFIWGACTLLFSLQTSVAWGAFMWAWNGVGLSFIIPNTQSLVADYYSDEDRGKAFGTLYTTGALGGMLGAVFATNMAGYHVLGMEGWRFAFRIIGAAAVIVGFVSLVYVKDPRLVRTVRSGETLDHGLPHKHSTQELLAEFCMVLKIPTFMVIIAQGIMGSTPWNALVFLTVYLQLIHFSDFNAAVVNATFLAGAALGGVLGGLVGDWAAKRNHDHGRIWTCQFSVFTGIPFTLLLLKALPRNGEPATVGLYCLTVFAMGLVHVWAGPNNNSIFAEIVPPHLRNLIYAFDRSFEMALASLGAPLVGLVAERLYGFPTEATIECDPATHQPIDVDRPLEHHKADALSSAMVVCMVIPWAACFTIYSFLHWTYPKDRMNASRLLQPHAGLAHVCAGEGGHHASSSVTCRC